MKAGRVAKQLEKITGVRNRCPKCGEVFDQGPTHCPHCGTVVYLRPEKRQVSTSLIALLVVCTVCTGIAGGCGLLSASLSWMDSKGDDGFFLIPLMIAVICLAAAAFFIWRIVLLRRLKQ